MKKKTDQQEKKNERKKEIKCALRSPRFGRPMTIHWIMTHLLRLFPRNEIDFGWFFCLLSVAWKIACQLKAPEKQHTNIRETKKRRRRKRTLKEANKKVTKIKKTLNAHTFIKLDINQQIKRRIYLISPLNWSFFICDGNKKKRRNLVSVNIASIYTK